MTPIQNQWSRDSQAYRLLRLTAALGAIVFLVIVCWSVVMSTDSAESGDGAGIKCVDPVIMGPAACPVGELSLEEAGDLYGKANF